MTVAQLENIALNTSLIYWNNSGLKKKQILKMQLHFIILKLYTVHKPGAAVNLDQ